jgi:hypothetical protein
MVGSSVQFDESFLGRCSGSPVFSNVQKALLGGIDEVSH